jgi:hypothetical protein
MVYDENDIDQSLLGVGKFLFFSPLSSFFFFR